MIISQQYLRLNTTTKLKETPHSHVPEYFKTLLRKQSTTRRKKIADFNRNHNFETLMEQKLLSKMC
jgi:hypothetical protein